MRRIKRIGETFLHLDDYLLRFLFMFLGGRECLAMELCLNRRLYTREYYACKIDYDDYDKEHEKTIYMNHKRYNKVIIKKNNTGTREHLNIKLGGSERMTIYV